MGRQRTAEAASGSRRSEVERLERLAWALDAVAVRLARGRPALDLALGEVFLRLSMGDRLAELGFAKMTDFANEGLGLPPRTFFALLELARGLRTRPLLRKAVAAGEVSALKARMVLKLPEGDDEATLVAAAMELSVAELKKLVKDGVADAPRYRSLRWSMTPQQQDRLDAALSLAMELEGYDAPEWRLQGRIARDWLAARGRDAGEESGSGPSDLLEGRKNSVVRQLEAHFEACEVLQADVGEENALGLQALARRFVRQRERFDEPLGRVLARIAREQLWRWLGYVTLGEYCRERLGISGSAALERIRLEKRMKALPLLRKALKSGKITYTNALQVSRHATRRDVEARIRAAAETTHRQTKRKADEEERERGRARGERKVRGPRAAMDLVSQAISHARQMFAVEGERLTDGEAWARVADWFVSRWAVPLKRADWRSRWQKDALLRHGGLCAAPGCTRAARHLHHIVYRSRGGPDAPWNVVAVCWAHHRLCIHRGLLTVRGRGGERLIWVFRGREPGTGDLVPLAQWETCANGEERRQVVARIG